MIVLKYREKESREANTFSAFLEPPIVHIRATIQRNDVIRPVEIALAAYVAARDTVPPVTDLFVYQMTRMGDECLQIHSVPVGVGINREPIYLVGVPSMLADQWYRAARPWPPRES